MDRALVALEKDSESVSIESGYSVGQSSGSDFISWLKGLLELNMIKDLLRSPWKANGKSLSFGTVFVFQFIFTSLIAFAIVYALARFL
jgi:hypothetical protein